MDRITKSKELGKKSGALFAALAFAPSFLPPCVRTCTWYCNCDPSSGVVMCGHVSDALAPATEHQQLAFTSCRERERERAFVHECAIEGQKVLFQD